MFKDTIMDLEPNTKLIRSLSPITIRLTKEGVQVIDKGVRYYNVKNLVWLSAGTVKIYGYLSIVIESWNNFLKREYPLIVSKGSQELIKLIEDDINDFIAILYETIHEIADTKNGFDTGLPIYPYNYVKIKINGCCDIMHDFYSPKDPEEYYYNKLSNIERVRYITIKGELMKILNKDEDQG